MLLYFCSNLSETIKVTIRSIGHLCGQAETELFGLKAFCYLAELCGQESCRCKKKKGESQETFKKLSDNILEKDLNYHFCLVTLLAIGLLTGVTLLSSPSDYLMISLQQGILT